MTQLGCESELQCKLLPNFVCEQYISGGVNPIAVLLKAQVCICFLVYVRRALLKQFLNFWATFFVCAIALPSFSLTLTSTYV